MAGVCRGSLSPTPLMSHSLRTGGVLWATSRWGREVKEWLKTKVYRESVTIVPTRTKWSRGSVKSRLSAMLLTLWTRSRGMRSVLAYRALQPLLLLPCHHCINLLIYAVALIEQLTNLLRIHYRLSSTKVPYESKYCTQSPSQKPTFGSCALSMSTAFFRVGPLSFLTERWMMQNTNPCTG